MHTQSFSKLVLDTLGLNVPSLARALSFQSSAAVYRFHLINRSLIIQAETDISDSDRRSRLFGLNLGLLCQWTNSSPQVAVFVSSFDAQHTDCLCRHLKHTITLVFCRHMKHTTSYRLGSSFEGHEPPQVSWVVN